MHTPVITMSTLGSNGRFANQIYQYAFLKIYSTLHNQSLETPEWIGQHLFGHRDPPVSRQLPQICVDPGSDYLADSLRQGAQHVPKNVDFWGYFQYHTKYYAPHKRYFQSLFTPVNEIEAKLSTANTLLRSRGKTVVGLHLRRNDYGYGPYFIAPVTWYKEWLEGIWDSLDEPVLFIATDEPWKVVENFSEYNPVTAEDVGAELAIADHYPDFYLLSKCDIVAISNSSYSFAASMLNNAGHLFLRPHLPSQKLIQYDPWNSDILLYDDSFSSIVPHNIENVDIETILQLCETFLETNPHDVVNYASYCINQSISTNSPVDKASFLLASALKEIGKLDIAIHVYRKTLELNPLHREAKIHLEDAILEKLRGNTALKNKIKHTKRLTRLPDLNFSFRNIFRENRGPNQENNYIVCAMFTPDNPKLVQYARRLARSCEMHNIPHIIYETPVIHRSINPSGDDDLAFTKPNFIYYNMQRFPCMNILYVDIDVFFITFPAIINDISNDCYDFAIYNWLSDIHNEGYLPISSTTDRHGTAQGYYAFSHRINYYSNEQLVCSGAVQYYKNSVKSKYLIESWQEVIACNPESADDECLDYAYNNNIVDLEDLKPFWLDKAYCRYPWWPHVQPVILHPDLPSAQSRPSPVGMPHRQRYYHERCQQKSDQLLFPKDHIIDTNNKLLYKIADNKIVENTPIEHDFWIFPETAGL